jgi:5-methylcytosine-specific restriction endonuclease McrA
MIDMKSRYPPVIEKGKCRGCGQPVPKGRQTWCSNKCWEPHTAVGRRTVLRRDKVCQICGFDILKALEEWRKSLKWHENSVLTRMHNPKPTYEIDHIIPFSEGGKTTYENLRLLCTPCHKARTKLWHKSRKAIKSAVQPDLIPA